MAENQAFLQEFQENMQRLSQINGIIQKLNENLTYATTLINPTLTGGKRSHRTKKHIPSAKKHSHKRNNQNKKRKTKTTQNKTRKH
jgi:hypothetical protein